MVEIPCWTSIGVVHFVACLESMRIPDGVGLEGPPVWDSSAHCIVPELPLLPRRIYFQGGLRVMPQLRVHLSPEVTRFFKSHPVRVDRGPKGLKLGA